MNQKLSQLPCNVKRRKNICEFTIIGGDLVGQVAFSYEPIIQTSSFHLQLDHIIWTKTLCRLWIKMLDTGSWLLVAGYWINAVFCQFFT